MHAWNTAKAAITIRQIGKKFVVMKPSMWMICHGSNSWQLHILVATTYVKNMTAWQKCLGDLRNSKGSRDLSATSMKILVSGVEQKCYWNFCVHTVYQSTWIRYKMQECHCFIAPSAHTSCRGNHVIPLLHAAFRQAVPLQILFSITYGFAA